MDMPILAGADGGIVYHGNWNLIVQAETQKEPESKKTQQWREECGGKLETENHETRSEWVNA